MNHRKRSGCSLRNWLRTLVVMLAVPFSLQAQETCSEEVKLLLSPAEVKVAIPVLQARGKTLGRVYFYDTPALDLLSSGVVLRLREGAEIDLTAKLRPLSGETFVDRAAVANAINARSI